MAVDRSKVLETAQKHLAKGHYDKAIAEYQKLVQADPRDVRTWLKIGDLYTRKGSRSEACETYARVAQHYANQGFFLKAVAVYKQILKLDPGRLDVSLSLAEMYERLQLVSDALNTYEHVAAAYAREGNIDRALDTLARMADLDPENIPVRIKLAEALSKAGRTDEAANAFAIGAELLKDQGRIDDYIKVAERLLYHRPKDVALARDLATRYLDVNDPKRALSKLQLCFKANPRDIDTLELLARAFHLLGQLPKTISVYKEIARIHQEAGRDEERAVILSRILELDPNDADARQNLAGYAPPQSQRSGSQAAPPPSAVVEPAEAPMEPLPDDDEPVLEVIEDDDDVMLADEDELEVIDDDVLLVESEPSMEIEVEPPTSDAPASSVRPSIPPDVAREAQIARLLTECDVFSRYGLRAKVVEQLRKVLDIAPDHVEARERLKDALVDQNRHEEAVIELYKLADLFEDEKPQVALLYYKQIVELDPSSEPARDHVMARASRKPPALDEDDEVMFVDDSTVDEPLDDRSEEPPTGHHPRVGDSGLGDQTVQEALPPPPPAPEMVPAQPPFAPPSVQSLAASLPSPEALTPGQALDPSVEADPSVGLPPQPRTPQPRPVTLPPPPADPTAAPIEEQGLAPMSPEEFEAAPLRPSSPGDMEAAKQRISLPPGEIEEVLDEAEFFLAQGLVEEARSTLREALTTHPDHPLLTDKLRELPEAGSVAPGPSDATADDSFLLAEKLAEELNDDMSATDVGSDVLDVESVFAQFKKGVEEQIGVEDSDTHFDLGIAYKEMGLLDDAVHEFELAKSNPTRECIAHTMIGLCHVEKGEIPEAIASFKKGLYAESKSEREELGLYFELGTAYELLHDPKEALYYYQKVQKRDAKFRNVGDKLRALTSRRAAPGATAAAEVDDVDRAFDDLMGED
ncbi:MAG: tetratricopeptide repeat protein [Myxococcota bacterium]